ncbi:hypothetical protein [Streptomyces niveus]
MANVLSCMSLLATYDGNPNDAVTLACRAQDAARAVGEQPLVMSMLHLREAFAHASLRDAEACRQAVDRSRDQFERSRGHEAEAPDWIQYFDETKLLVDTGIAYARLGEPARADPSSLRACVERTPTSSEAVPFTPTGWPPPSSSWANSTRHAPAPASPSTSPRPSTRHE